MALLTDIEVYREPRTRMVGLTRLPPDHSTDNGILFSSTYLALLSRLGLRAPQEVSWFQWLVESCTIHPGLLCRYPGDAGLESHDDLTGVAVVAYLYALPYAKDIHQFGVYHDYSWNNQKPEEWTWRSWLSRILGFEPFLRVAAGLPLGYFSQIQVCLAFLINCFEPRSETSGKCLLYLRSQVLYGHYQLVDAAIDLWRARMLAQFPHGMREVYAIFFGATHPFTLYGPDDFQ